MVPATSGRPSSHCGESTSVAGLVFEISSMLTDGVEARWIVAEATRLSMAALAVYSDDPVSQAQRSSARAMADRLLGGEPLQHVLGTWSFRRLEVTVDRRALVPRPETEQLVGAALEESTRTARSRSGRMRCVDLGTGSGVIALSLALEGPSGSDIWATERSEPALELARVNLERLALSHPEPAARVRLVQGSWFEALSPELRGTLDLVVSNPPYVSAREWETLEPVVRHYDPRQALVAGETGQEALRLITAEAAHWLRPGGALVLELAPAQARPTAGFAADNGFHDVQVQVDLAGRHRVLVARRPVT